MADVVMVLGSIVLSVLLSFIFFVFIVTILSHLRRERKVKFEPRLSVVIPCYNEEKHIKRCLDSIFASDYDVKKLDVVVVDDGSVDRTPEILREYKGIKVVHGKHEGKSASLNLGAAKAKYDIILTIDADTVVSKDALKKIVMPFYYVNVGATNGSCVVKNRDSILGMFQNIEYHYNNLVRKSFSRLFKNGIWFFGAFACYRREVLEKIGYFKKDTLTEDMDTALEIYSAGYKIVNVHDALGYTIVPTTLSGFVKQRVRWWYGVLQSLTKNKHLFSHRSNPSIIFLFVNQFWWTLYAVLSIPLIAYQFNYWLPYNMDTFMNLFLYTFRWFTLLGSFHVIYMIPEWGINYYSISGVLSGLLSTVLIIYSIYMFRDRLHLKNIIAIFLYFPYTIVLNTIIVVSLVKGIFLRKKYFID